jgi:hypothetical protein
MTKRQRLLAARTNPSKTLRDPLDLQRSIEIMRDYRRQRFTTRVIVSRSLSAVEAV